MSNRRPRLPNEQYKNSAAMPVFRYKAVAARENNIIQGVVKAPSRDLAVAKLQSAGHLPISAEKIHSWRLYDLQRLLTWRVRNRIAAKDIMLITRELATLLQAGLPLDQALRTLSQLDLPEATQRLLRDLLEDIQGGAGLSGALANQAGVFDNIYVSIVRSGEASGALDLTLGHLADYLERVSELRDRLITALIYPVILLGFSILSLIVLMTFVVPEFIPLFKDAEQALPLMTELVFKLSTLFQQYWWLPLFGFGLLLWLVNKYLLSKPDYRLRFDNGCLHLPGIGDIIKQIEMARFASALSVATSNGVPLPTGIRLAKDVVLNRRIAKTMNDALESLEQGRSMAKPLKDSGVCPALAAQLIEVGENSGQLEAMLAKVAELCDKQAQTRIKHLLTVLEPLLILGLGGLIAVIIVSVLLAVLSLNQLVIL